MNLKIKNGNSVRYPGAYTTYWKVCKIIRPESLLFKVRQKINEMNQSSVKDIANEDTYYLRFGKSLGLFDEYTPSLEDFSLYRYSSNIEYIEFFIKIENNEIFLCTYEQGSYEIEFMNFNTNPIQIISLLGLPSASKVVTFSETDSKKEEKRNHLIIDLTNKDATYIGKDRSIYLNTIRKYNSTEIKTMSFTVSQTIPTYLRLFITINGYVSGIVEIISNYGEGHIVKGNIKSIDTNVFNEIIKWYIKDNRIYLEINQGSCRVTILDYSNIHLDDTEYIFYAVNPAIPDDTTEIEFYSSFIKNDDKNIETLFNGEVRYSLQYGKLVAYLTNKKKYVDFEGKDLNVKSSGVFSEKPNADQGIKVGFQFFCTDRKTSEGSTNGIMIYHKGDNVWVDALGRIVS